MPVYEYEPVDHDCLMCPNRVAVIQSASEEPLKYCPDCGLDVRKVISEAAFKMDRSDKLERAGARGFTTWKRAQEGTWEKVSGPGVDVIQGSPEDIAAVKEKPAKVLDLGS